MYEHVKGKALDRARRTLSVGCLKRSSGKKYPILYMSIRKENIPSKKPRMYESRFRLSLLLAIKYMLRDSNAFFNRGTERTLIWKAVSNSAREMKKRKVTLQINQEITINRSREEVQKEVNSIGDEGENGFVTCKRYLQLNEKRIKTSYVIKHL